MIKPCNLLSTLYSSIGYPLPSIFLSPINSLIVDSFSLVKLFITLITVPSVRVL